jgi:hypothetical protein
MKDPGSWNSLARFLPAGPGRDSLGPVICLDSAGDPIPAIKGAGSALTGSHLTGPYRFVQWDHLLSRVRPVSHSHGGCATQIAERRLSEAPVKHPASRRCVATVVGAQDLGQHGGATLHASPDA